MNININRLIIGLMVLQSIVKLMVIYDQNGHGFYTIVRQTRSLFYEVCIG